MFVLLIILFHYFFSISPFVVQPQSSKFSDIKFNLKVRQKLKVIIRKNNLPLFPHLTYPGDPKNNSDVEDDEVCGFFEDENQQKCVVVDQE